MVKKPLISGLTLLLIISLSPVVYGDGGESFYSLFRSKPITSGIHAETGYTLGRGEWKVGSLTLPGAISQWERTYVRYGLTENLQLGTALPRNFLGRPNVSAKFQLPFKGPAGAGLAIPASLDLAISPLGTSANAGLAASWSLTERIGLHSGINVWLVSYIYRLFNPSVYAVVDYDLLSNFKAIGEVDLHAFGQDYLDLRVGGLTRVLDVINLKFSVSVDLPSGDNSMGANIFLRF